MNKFLWGCVALVGLFVVAESLNCYSCPATVGDVCLVRTNTTCGTETNCYTGRAVFNFSSLLNVQSKGCLDTAFCNKTLIDKFLGANYNITTNCCSTDLCNGAGAVPLHLTLALGAALVAVRSVFA